MITSAILNPNNPFQLITSSLDGLIRVWDFLDAVLLQTISIEQPIIHLCAHEKFPEYVFVAVVKNTKKLNSNGAFGIGPQYRCASDHYL
jgi:NET1-associated nuclear protein 1 (U3 small nucleolar RNA-associated protein 17)